MMIFLALLVLHVVLGITASLLFLYTIRDRESVALTENIAMWVSGLIFFGGLGLLFVLVAGSLNMFDYKSHLYAVKLKNPFYKN